MKKLFVFLPLIISVTLPLRLNAMLEGKEEKSEEGARAVDRTEGNSREEANQVAKNNLQRNELGLKTSEKPMNSVPTTSTPTIVPTPETSGGIGGERTIHAQLDSRTIEVVPSTPATFITARPPSEIQQPNDPEAPGIKVGVENVTPQKTQDSEDSSSLIIGLPDRLVRAWLATKNNPQARDRAFANIVSFIEDNSRGDSVSTQFLSEAVLTRLRVDLAQQDQIFNRDQDQGLATQLTSVKKKQSKSEPKPPSLTECLIEQLLPNPHDQEEYTRASAEEKREIINHLLPSMSSLESNSLRDQRAPRLDSAPPERENSNSALRDRSVSSDLVKSALDTYLSHSGQKAPAFEGYLRHVLGEVITTSSSEDGKQELAYKENPSWSISTLLQYLPRVEDNIQKIKDALQAIQEAQEQIQEIQQLREANPSPDSVSRARSTASIELFEKMIEESKIFLACMNKGNPQEARPHRLLGLSFYCQANSAFALYRREITLDNAGRAENEREATCFLRAANYHSDASMDYNNAAIDYDNPTIAVPPEVMASFLSAARAHSDAARDYERAARAARGENQEESARYVTQAVNYRDQATAYRDQVRALWAQARRTTPEARSLWR